MSEDTETHFEPASTSYGSYATSGFPTHVLTFHVESNFEPNTMSRGTLIPYHAERFGSTSHISPSVPVVEVTSHIPLGSRVSDPIRICCAPTQQLLKNIISLNKIVFCFDEMFEFHIANLKN